MRLSQVEVVPVLQELAREDGQPKHTDVAEACGVDAAEVVEALARVRARRAAIRSRALFALVVAACLSVTLWPRGEDVHAPDPAQPDVRAAKLQ